MSSATHKKPLTASGFITLSDAEKEQIYRECEKITPSSGVPLTPDEQALHERFLRRANDSTAAEGNARIQATMERGLLRRADAYARRHGLTRSQLIARGLEKLLAAGQAAKP